MIPAREDDQLVYNMASLSGLSLSLEQSQYPNCAYRLAAAGASNSSEYFIDLALFAFEGSPSSTSQAISDFTTAGDQSSLMGQIYASLFNYIIMFAIVAVFVLVVITLRTKTAFSGWLTKFFSLQAIRVLQPAEVLTNTICFICFVLFLVCLPQMEAALADSSCLRRNIRQTVAKGETKNGWGGVQWAVDHMRSQIKLLEVFQQMPNTFSSDHTSIERRIPLHSNYTPQLLQQYVNQSVQAGTQYTNLQTLLPQLLGTQQLLIGLNESIEGVLSVARTLVSAQQQLDLLRQKADSHRISLQTKIVMYERVKQLTQSGDYEQGGFNMQQWIPFAKYMAILLQVFTYLCPEVILINLLLLVVLTRFREPIFVKCVNFLWVVNLLFILLGIPMLFYFSQLFALSQGYCSLLKTDQLQNQAMGLFEYSTLFSSCFDGRGQFAADDEIGVTLPALTTALGNLTLFLHQHNPKHQDYANSYAFKQTLSSLNAYVMEQQTSKQTEWAYIQSLIDQLNLWTLHDQSNENCYQHRWVLDSSQCESTDVVLSPSTSQNLRNAANINCLSTSWQSAGSTHLINFGELMSNYANDQANCPGAYSKINQYGQQLTDALANVSDSLEGLKAALMNESDDLLLLVKIVRSHHSTQKDQYEYLTSFAYETPAVTRENEKIINDIIDPPTQCSIIKQKSHKLQQIVCQRLRPAIAQCYLLVVAIMVSLGVMGLVGMCRGYADEARIIGKNERVEEEDEEEGVDYGVEPANNRHFFREKKHS